MPGRDVMASSISIVNEPTFLGMRAPRDTAEIDSARLFDMDAKEYVGPVLMWVDEGSRTLVTRRSIASGKQATLYVAGKDRWSPDYFVFSGTSLNTALPERLTILPNDKRDYEIHLYDSIGRRYRIGITLKNSDQSVNIGFKITFGHRLRMISRGFSTIAAAFKIYR